MATDIMATSTTKLTPPTCFLGAVSLIETLTRTKESAAKIAAALKESGKASEQLDVQREVYRGFASSGSKLFFLISQLLAVNPMYQFSLAR